MLTPGGVALEQMLETLPRETAPLAATAQPCEPGALGRIDQTRETAEIAVHSKIVEVSDQPSLERCMLHVNREMSMATTPLGDGL